MARKNGKRGRSNRTKRNDSCPCGSGRKFKDCHQLVQQAPPAPSIDWAKVDQMTRAAKAQEIRRQASHGRGKPLITGTVAGHRLVSIDGKSVSWGPWKTMSDLFYSNMRKVLGQDWVDGERAKSFADRHPIIQWEVPLLKNRKPLEPGEKDITSTPMNGAMYMYLGLAYHLFLLQHDAEIVEDLVHRLKTRDHWMGAWYEAFIAACFIRAGFKLEIEDERDGSGKHHEFIATHPSGRKYSVEARTRQPYAEQAKIVSKLKKALKKQTPHARIVFIDINIAYSPGETAESWIGGKWAEVKESEQTMWVNGKPAPPAYVVITNRPHLYDLEGISTPIAILAMGYKIPDFGHGAAYTSLAGQWRANKKHADVEAALKAMQEYQVPSTFSGDPPEFEFGAAKRKWVLGNSYDLDEQNKAAVLVNGIVMEEAKNAWLTFRLTTGQSVFVVVPLNDAELSAYRHHPETFFGEPLEVQHQLTDPISHFAWFYEHLKGATREQMLKFFVAAVDLPRLEQLNDPDLYDVYCERHAIAMLMRSGMWPPKVPPGVNTPGNASMVPPKSGK